MTMLNTEVRIQDTNGTVLSTIPLNAFWSPAPGPNYGRFDPRIVYDPGSGRWFAICVTDEDRPTSAVLLAVSTTSDPSDPWGFWRLDADPADVWWADFPDIGFNSNWIVITSNVISGGGSVGDVVMWVIDKASILGQPPVLQYTYFPLSFENSGQVDFNNVYSFTMRPCVTFGAEPKVYIVDCGFSLWNLPHFIRISEVTGPVSSPVWQVTAGSQWPETGLFRPSVDWLGPSTDDAEQPGTTTLINTRFDWIRNAVYRNGKIWCVHHVTMPKVPPWIRGNILWYQINPLAMPNPVVQAGIIGGVDHVWHYYPSIAVNAREDVLIGFTRSSPSIYAQAAYTGRKATDPLGYMNPISVLKLGEDTYIKDFGYGDVRWGDYSATVVDSTNDIEMWTIQEYSVNDVGPNPSDDRWGTWWGLACECIAKSGDANADGGVNIADIYFLVNYVFHDQQAPSPLCRGDVVGDGTVLLTDIVYLINYVFHAGPPPVKTCQCCV